jgi:hypothetical protein
LFEAGVLQSGFWHQFAMTAHSPVGLEPAKFGVVPDSDIVGSFANNDVAFTDKTGIDHDKFSFGLKKSLFNYMHGICFDYPLQDWFEFKIPRTKIHPDFIHDALMDTSDFNVKPTSKVVWVGKMPLVSAFVKSKKGNSWPMLAMEFHDRRSVVEIQFGEREGEWLLGILDAVSVFSGKPMTFGQVKSSFEDLVAADFELFWFSKPVEKLRDAGLLLL